MTHEEVVEVLVQLTTSADRLAFCLDCEPYWGKGGVGRIKSGRGVIPFAEARAESLAQLKEAVHNATVLLYRAGRWRDFSEFDPDTDPKEAKPR